MYLLEAVTGLAHCPEVTIYRLPRCTPWLPQSTLLKLALVTASSAALQEHLSGFGQHCPQKSQHLHWETEGCSSPSPPPALGGVLNNHTKNSRTLASLRKRYDALMGLQKGKDGLQLLTAALPL